MGKPRRKKAAVSKASTGKGEVSPLVWAGMALVAALVLSTVYTSRGNGEQQVIKSKKARKPPAPPPQPKTGIFDEAIPFADPAIAQAGPHRTSRSALLQRWNPVAINHTRQLILDPSGKMYVICIFHPIFFLFSLPFFLLYYPLLTTRLASLLSPFQLLSDTT